MRISAHSQLFGPALSLLNQRLFSPTAPNWQRDYEKHVYIQVHNVLLQVLSCSCGLAYVFYVTGLVSAFDWVCLKNNNK